MTELRKAQNEQQHLLVDSDQARHVDGQYVDQMIDGNNDQHERPCEVEEEEVPTLGLAGINAYVGSLFDYLARASKEAKRHCPLGGP